MPEALVRVSSEGYFTLQIRNGNNFTAILPRNIAGWLDVVKEITPKEAAAQLVEELEESGAFLATSSVQSVFYGTGNTKLPRNQQEKLDRVMAQLHIEKKLLTPKQYERIKNLIRDKLPAFATQPSEMGATDIIEHDIEVDPKEKPIAQKNRRLPFAVKEEITKKIQELLEQGIIQPSDSDWCSPIVPVRKKNGEIRMCIDYRQLNKVTKKDNSPLSILNDLIDQAGMKGNKVFSGFDLMSGYHQVRMTPRARRLSAFVSHMGMFEWVRMPFGLCNAPATFSNLMRKVLATLQSNAVFAYLDDVLIASPDVDHHIKDMENLLDRFIDVGLTIQPKKSFLFHDQLTFLGFVVSKDGVKADPAKLEAITKFPKPDTIKKLKGFVALCSYYRRFVQGFSKIAKPLTDAMRNKPLSLVWTPPMEEAFARMKLALTKPPVLAYPKYGERYYLECDGSKLGLGCVLSQMQSDGKLHPIAFGSRAVSRQEERYSATDLEACAVIFGLDHFDVYIRGHQVTVITDHKALTYILKSRNHLTNDRQQRWRNRFMGQEIEVKYRAGRNHVVPDVLSRQTRTDTRPEGTATPLEEDRYDDLYSIRVDDTEQGEDGLSWLLAGEFVSIPIDNQLWTTREEQRKDRYLRDLMDYCEFGVAPESRERRHWVRRFAEQCNVIKGVLYHSTNHTELAQIPVVPLHSRYTLLQEAHSGSTGGHFGPEKTHEKLARRFWWPFMQSDVILYCKDCLQCVGRSGQTRQWVPPLVAFEGSRTTT